MTSFSGTLYLDDQVFAQDVEGEFELQSGDVSCYRGSFTLPAEQGVEIAAPREDLVLDTGTGAKFKISIPHSHFASDEPDGSFEFISNGIPIRDFPSN